MFARGLHDAVGSFRHVVETVKYLAETPLESRPFRP